VRLYTRAGDAGRTRLADGAAVDKDDVRLEAYGTVDELNSSIGVIRASADDERVDGVLARTQAVLFELSMHLSDPRSRAESVTAADVAWLESEIDAATDECPPLRSFILPGGTPVAAAAHVSRTVCRRAERRVFSLVRGGVEATLTLQFLNRLSDLLFALARLMNFRAGLEDEKWQRRGSSGPGGPS